MVGQLKFPQPPIVLRMKCPTNETQERAGHGGEFGDLWSKPKSYISSRP